MGNVSARDIENAGDSLGQKYTEKEVANMKPEVRKIYDEKMAKINEA